jgi:hypothetical protein
MASETLSSVELIGGILEHYAQRGVFRGFSRGPVRGGRAFFRLLWHRDRFFDLILDERQKTLHFSVLLPEVSAKSSMYRELKQFLELRHSENLPEHRRINRQKARVLCKNRGGNVSLALIVEDGDYDYGTRKLIHLVHEVFLGFLYDGPYSDYIVEAFDLSPDWS